MSEAFVKLPLKDLMVSYALRNSNSSTIMREREREIRKGEREKRERLERKREKRERMKTLNNVDILFAMYNILNEVHRLSTT